MIRLADSLLCENCAHVVDATHVKGEVCPKCSCQGALLSLQRVLNPTPELGVITYIVNVGRA